MRMQLNNTNIKTALFAASCALLGDQTVASDWEIDSAIMYYGETDRVQAAEAIIQGSKSLSNDREVSLKLVLDSLTGASASGAVAQPTAQTFTSPSGNAQYETEANTTPLDSTFHDTRFQVAGQWSQPLSENYTFSTGVNFSNEFDYQSFAVNGSVARFLNSKNTTVSLGISSAFDTIKAVGGQPVGLSSMVVDSGQFASDADYQAAFDATRQTEGDDTKSTVDLVLGITQGMNRRWLTQFNLGFSSVSGYLTDPYKLVSSLDESGLAVAQLYESRPDTRSKQFFYAQSKYHFENSIWDVSYRLTNDDWGIASHTLESRYKFLFKNKSYLEPHIRIYQQQEADFYRPYLMASDDLPEFASADYRIGKLNAYTVGLKYGKTTAKGNEYGIRLEYYSQAPQSIGGEVPEQLEGLDLYSSIDAVILQFNYKF